MIIININLKKNDDNADEMMNCNIARKIKRNDNEKNTDLYKKKKSQTKESQK